MDEWGKHLRGIYLKRRGKHEGKKKKRSKSLFISGDLEQEVKKSKNRNTMEKETSPEKGYSFFGSIESEKKRYEKYEQSGSRT